MTHSILLLCYSVALFTGFALQHPLPSLHAIKFLFGLGRPPCTPSFWQDDAFISNLDALCSVLCFCDGPINNKECLCPLYREFVPLWPTHHSLTSSPQIGNSAGNTYADWLDDIQKAKDAHIDGFALNIAPADSYTTNSLTNAYNAADQLGEFKLFLSFDYLSEGPWSSSAVVSTINAYKSHASQFLVDNNPFVSTFEGVDNAGDWASIKSQVSIFFVPSWTSLGPQTVAANGNVDGAFSWAAWPTGANDMTDDDDKAWIQALGSKPFMMSVSPWFYTNLPNWNKNWLWRGDDLWYDRWQQVIELQPPFVEVNISACTSVIHLTCCQIITWNDYGESHYIGPIRSGIPSGAEWYVNNASTPHDHWREMLPAYIDAYKSGNTTVANVTQEKLSFWYRLSPAAACSGDGTTGNTASQGQTPVDPNTVVQDKVFVDTLVASPADVIIQIGSGAVTTQRATHAGVNHFSVPFAGQTGVVAVSISRNGQPVVEATGQAISDTCPNGNTNYNAFVGGSS